MFLKGTGRSLVINMTGTCDLDVHASYSDQDSASFGTSSEFVHDSKQTNVTGAGDTTLLAAPGNSTTTRTIKRLVIANRSASVSATGVLRIADSGSDPDAEIDETLLLPKEKVIWREGVYYHMDARGAIYSVTTTGVDPRTNDFRLSGVTATPVMTADNAALGTIFLCQWKGNRLALNDGTAWQLAMPTSEVSLAVTGRTTDLPFDIFAFLSAGVVTLEFANWTNATTRATGLTRVDGVWTKTGDATRRYLGSCRARSATTYSWVTTGDGASTSTRLDLWNADNRMSVAWKHIESTNTWAYTLATIRQARGSTNNQVDIMVGLQEEAFEATLAVTGSNSTISISRNVGIGVDSTTVFNGIFAETTNEVASIPNHCFARIAHQPTIGRHFYAWNEISTATGTMTFLGDNGALRNQSGMTGVWAC